MNLFKSLDTLFPVGSERTFGEVVSCDIRVYVAGVDLGEISVKRKDGSVNASVNAFHMHRGLVRDFMNSVRGLGLTRERVRRSKRLIAHAVLCSYLRNHENGTQVSAYNLHVEDGPYGSVSMWEDYALSNDWREIVDSPCMDMASMLETDVAVYRARHWISKGILVKEFPSSI